MSKHYRFLNEGETIQQGDEWYSEKRREWRPAFHRDIGDVFSFSDTLFRHPLGSETCDHITQPQYRASIDDKTVFNFCPLCGMPLEVEE